MTIKKAVIGAGLHLSDTGLVLLSHAAGREGGMLLPAPETVRARGSALEKVLVKLLRQGLVEKVAVAHGTRACRTGEDGQWIGLRITEAGVLAIGMQTQPAAAQAGCAENNDPVTAEKECPASEPHAVADPEPEPAPASNDPALAEPSAAPSRSAARGKAGTASALRPGSKQALLVEQLGSLSGATLSDLVALLSWQPHTVRAALTGLRRKGFAVTRTRNDDGETIYRASRPEPAEEQAPAEKA